MLSLVSLLSLRYIKYQFFARFALDIFTYSVNSGENVEGLFALDPLTRGSRIRARDPCETPLLFVDLFRFVTAEEENDSEGDDFTRMILNPR